MASNYQISDFGVTQRDAIRNDLDQQRNAETSQIEVTFETTTTHQPRETREPEKNRYMCVKYCACAVVVCAAIAGVVAAAVGWRNTRDDGGTLGGLQDEEELTEECPRMFVGLGSRITIVCSFSKPVWEDIESTTVKYQPVGKPGKELFTCEADGDTHYVTCTGPRATCSNEGSITITFDSGHTSTTSLIIAGAIVRRTELRQNVDNGQYTFTLACRATGMCQNPNMIFTADNSRDILTGKQFETCDISFDDASGYIMECEDTVDGSVIETYGARNPKCEITDEFANTLNSRPFSIIQCLEYSDDCLNNDVCEHRIDIENNCTAVCGLLEHCLEAGTFRTDTTPSSNCPTRCYPKWCVGTNSVITTISSLFDERCTDDRED